VASGPEAQAQPAGGDEDIADELSFREAQTALELSLAELQAPDLDVEQMAGLYRRASRYADRCEQLLHQVEQEVMQWNPDQPDDTPLPYQA
jgi:exodeoxyribonuclease VII small subunit